MKRKIQKNHISIALNTFRDQSNISHMEIYFPKMSHLLANSRLPIPVRFVRLNEISDVK